MRFRPFFHASFLLFSLGALSFCAKPQTAAVNVVGAIAAGHSSGCAIVNGGLQCWGSNTFGQLGNGTLIDSATPKKVVGLSGTIANVTTKVATCATADGVLYCWGYNAQGQLGTGDLGTNHSRPTQVLGTFTNIKQVDTNGSNTCALSDEGMSCWGQGHHGQIGNGIASMTGVDTPYLVPLSGIPTQIGVGARETCAVIDGGLWCWGNNDHGQLGRGTTGGDGLVPTLVTGLSSGVTKVVGMDSSFCALLESGTIKCWGWNSRGQLGNNSTTDSDVPVDVSRLTSGVTDISASTSGGTMFAIANGELFVWGQNDRYQLGDDTTTDSPVPISVVGLGGTIDAISGSIAPCVLISGELYFWGANSLGSFGNKLEHKHTPFTPGAWWAP